MAKYRRANVIQEARSPDRLKFEYFSREAARDTLITGKNKIPRLTRPCVG